MMDSNNFKYSDSFDRIEVSNLIFFCNLLMWRKCYVEIRYLVRFTVRLRIMYMKIWKKKFVTSKGSISFSKLILSEMGGAYSGFNFFEIVLNEVLWIYEEICTILLEINYFTLVSFDVLCMAVNPRRISKRSFAQGVFQNIFQDLPFSILGNIREQSIVKK